MSRAIRGIVATLGVVAATASFAAPIGKVGVLISGQELGSGKEIHGTSGTKRIIAAEAYTYQLSGKCRGKAGTALGKLIPKDVAISAFIESLSPGASSYLSGTFTNPGGTLPVTVLNKKISGKRTIAGVGVVKVTLTIVGKILANGECVVDVTNVKFSTKPKRNVGSIVFKGGSKLLISAAPTITFKRLNTNVSENAGSVVVPVYRDSNRHGAASIKYSTVNGTADSSHFTPVIDGIIDFADGETQKNITLQILNNVTPEPNRTFSIQLSEPGNGALLGSQTSTTVTITDDD